MLHQMKLKSEPFEKMKSGAKTVELRLNDEKRQLVQIGDFIEFTLIDVPDQKLTARVITLHHFDSFRELYAALPKGKMGYRENEVPNPDHIYQRICKSVNRSSIPRTPYCSCFSLE